MNNNDKSILNYIDAKSKIFEYFDCSNDYFIKPAIDCKWIVKGDEDFYFLSYFDENDKKTDAVVVRKNGEPLIYKTDLYTMVIAIDCVKIAFIFKNSNMI